jgi:hypothetical protein
MLLVNLCNPMKLNHIIIIAFIFLVPGKLFSATITAVNDGNWGSNSVWSCNCQPGNDDNIVIPAGRTVTASGVVLLIIGPVINITVGGTLVLNNATISLDSSDIVTILTGGKISGTGIFGGSVSEGFSSISIPNGSGITGPKTYTNGTLPIKLVYFRNTVNEDGILLEWASSEEKNFDYYDLSTSVDGKSFTSIATIGSKGENAAEYNFTDTSPLAATNYYKLTAVDLDGSREEMSVIKAEWNGRKEWISIYPNPVSDGVIHVRLFGSGSGSLHLLDCNGMPIAENLVVNAFSSDIRVPAGVPPGAYFISAEIDGRVTRIKVIIAR